MGEKYDDKGSLSSYRTSAEQFPNPEGLKTFPGYGADKADLERGFCRPEILERPQYEKKDYELRYSLPKISDLDEDGPSVKEDIEFRTKDIETKGFLTRPRIPSER